MPGLNNVTCGDNYTDAASVINVWNSKGGWFSISTESAYVELQYGDLGSPYFVAEQLLGAGAFAAFDKDCSGIRFRNATAGQNSVVTAYIAQGDEPPLSILSSGNVTVTGSPGTLQRITYITGATPFTTTAATNQLRVILVGAGGGGSNGGGAGKAGSGGGAGGYTDTGLIAATPSTLYAHAIGVGGVHGGPPVDGTDTTLTVGGTTYLATGGSGGASGSAFTLGGVGGSGSSPTGVVVAGEEGGASITFNTGAYIIGGKGGNSAYGGGGPGAMAAGGNNAADLATGYGAGGGGGAGSGNGSSGTDGLIIIEEYA